MGNCLAVRHNPFAPFETNHSTVSGPLESSRFSKALEYSIPGKTSRFYVYKLARREVWDGSSTAKLMTKMADRLGLEENHEEAARLRLLAKAGYILRMIDASGNMSKERKNGLLPPETRGPEDTMEIEGRMAGDLKKDACYLFLKIGDYDKSLRIFQKVGQCQMENFGARSAETLKTLQDVATVLFAQGNFNESLKMYTQVYEGYKEFHRSSQHPETVAVLGRIGWCLSEKGEFYDEALAILKQVYDIQLATFGRNDPTTLNTFQDYFTTVQRHSERVKENPPTGAVPILPAVEVSQLDEVPRPAPQLNLSVAQPTVVPQSLNSGPVVLEY